MTFNRNSSVLLPFTDAATSGYGGFCRTGSLIFSYSSSLTEAWLELQETKPNKWLVHKVTYELVDLLETDAAAPTIATDDDKRAVPRPKAYRQNTLASDVSLLDGLKILAHFEASTLAVGQAIRGKDTPQSLGAAHYVAFGLSKGIAFDEETGAPCETVEGRIVASGTFTDVTRDAVMAAWKKKQHDPNADIVDMLFAQGNVSLYHFTDFMNAADEYMTVKRLSSAYDTTYLAMKECFDYNFGYKMDIQKFEDALKDFRSSERHYPEQFRPFVAKSAALFQIAFDIERKKANLKNALDGPAKLGDFSKTFSSVYKDVQDSLKKDGLDLDGSSIIKTLLNTPITEKPVIPRSFTECRFMLDKRAQELQKQTESMRLKVIR